MVTSKNRISGRRQKLEDEAGWVPRLDILGVSLFSLSVVFDTGLCGFARVVNWVLMAIMG